MKHEDGGMPVGGRFLAFDFLAFAGMLCLVGGVARAQESAPAGDQGYGDQGYKVGEKPAAHADASPTTADKKATETRRLARFDYVSGNVTVRGDDKATWTRATTNMPLVENMQIWATDGGRAEIRFDDGSLLRLGNGALVTLQTVYGDAEGEFTQIKLISGLVTLRPKRERSVYQIDTPFNTVKTAGPARVRVGVGDDVEVGVRLGQATVEGKQGKTVVHAGSYLAVGNADAPYDIHGLPAEDSWERWNDERDHKLDPGYPIYPGPRPVYVPAPVYVPRPSVWFGLDFPVYRHYGWGRGGHWRR